ncbi:hypothetical protein JCM8202_002855 [Rhodotorula sphaerocarpa]
MAAGATETHAQLERALKATTLQLSRILAYQARVEQHRTAHFAPPAPRALTRQLAADTDAFDACLHHLELRVLRAIAVLERDARRANGLPPATTAAAPAAVVPAPVGDPATSASTATAAQDELPFSLPSASAAAEAPNGTSTLDLTDSPALVPTVPGPAPGDLPQTSQQSHSQSQSSAIDIDLTMPLQLPPSAGAAPAGSSSTSQSGTAASATPAAPSTSAAEATGGTTGSAGAFPESTSDDIDALLSSLNLPTSFPPGASSSSPSALSFVSGASIASSGAAGGAQPAFDYSSLLLDPALAADLASTIGDAGQTTAPGGSNAATNQPPQQQQQAPPSSSGPATGLGLDVAPPGASAAGSLASSFPPFSSSMSVSAPTLLAPSAASAASAATAATSAAPAAPAVSSASAGFEFDLNNFDLSALGLDPGSFQPATSGAANSGLGGAGAEGSSQQGQQQGQDQSSAQPAGGGASDMMDIDELLKSLGGGTG